MQIKASLLALALVTDIEAALHAVEQHGAHGALVHPGTSLGAMIEIAKRQELHPCERMSVAGKFLLAGHTYGVGRCLSCEGYYAIHLVNECADRDHDLSSTELRGEIESVTIDS